MTTALHRQNNGESRYNFGMYYLVEWKMNMSILICGRFSAMTAVHTIDGTTTDVRTSVNRERSILIDDRVIREEHID
jgi:hypothetical protein